MLNVRDVYLSMFKKLLKEFGDVKLAPMQIDVCNSETKCKIFDIESQLAFNALNDLNNQTKDSSLDENYIKIPKILGTNTNRNALSCMIVFMEEAYIILKSVENFDFVQDENFHILANISRDIIQIKNNVYKMDLDSFKKFAHDMNALCEMYKKHVSPSGDEFKEINKKYINDPLFTN